MNRQCDGLTMGRVVVIGIPVLLVGGTEMQTLSVAKILVSVGCRVIVCCYHEHSPAVVSQFEAAGAEVRLLDFTRQAGISWLLRLIPRLAKIFRSYQPDIVHVQYIAPGLVPIIAARLAGVRTVFATIHIAGSVAYGKKAKWMLRAAAQLCTTFICVSKDVEKFWFGDAKVFDADHPACNRRHFTIYNAVDAERVCSVVLSTDRDEIRDQLKLKDKKVIGILGRLAVQKGHKILLDAMADIVSAMPDTVLVIIGDGPENERLKVQAESLGLSEHIRWLGSMPQEEAWGMFSVMDIFVMPSLFEGFGLTAAEAMAAGLPVVGTQVDGLSDVIEDGVTGYLVPPSDRQALAESLIVLLNDTSLAKRFGQNGRDRVQKYFSLDRFSGYMLRLYGQYLPSLKGNTTNEKFRMDD